jgi:teichuronic acid biosynthesis glycosyltransferase TuaH
LCGGVAVRVFLSKLEEMAFPHDLIFLSLENWDDIWRRNQFVCAALARRHPEMRIVFVGLPRNVGQHLKAGKIRPLFERSTNSVPNLQNITVTRPWRIGPETYDWGLKWNELLYRRHLRGLVRKLQLRDPLLWINSHGAHFLPDYIPHSGLIYDITDDWTTSSQSEIDRRRTVAADAALCQRADATIVCSERLHELKRDLVSNLYLIPNGVDAAHYSTVLNTGGAILQTLSELPHPIFGYTGTVHPDRIDLDLVVAVARRFTTGSVVLVGPSHLDARELDKLRMFPNIHLVGAASYQQVPDYMRSFDVSITPHRVTPFTESLNPIKLWEYLAAGKPIVATPVAGFRDFPDLVRVASTPDEFVDELVAALEEGNKLSAERQRIARENSWDARVDDIEKVMANVIGASGRSNPKSGPLDLATPAASSNTISG